MTTVKTHEQSDALKMARQSLVTAENELRAAAGTAVSNADYDSLSVISSWAKSIKNLIDQDEHPAISGFGALHSNGGSSVVNGATVPSRRTPGKRRKKQAEEPVYRRESDFLVKSARSRKTKTAYEHKAPSEVIFVLSQCLAEKKPSRKLITADDLLNAYVKRKGTVAAYQLYVALGWLVQLGLVDRHARSGYSVPSANTIVNDVKSAWEALGENKTLTS
jgi:hypothetical protein